MKRLTLPNTILPIKLGYYNAKFELVTLMLDCIDARKVYQINKIPIETDSIKDEDDYGVLSHEKNATQYRRFYNTYNGTRKYTITLTNAEILIENNRSSHNMLIFDNDENALTYYLALRKVD